MSRTPRIPRSLPHRRAVARALLVATATVAAGCDACGRAPGPSAASSAEAPLPSAPASSAEAPAPSAPPDADPARTALALALADPGGSSDIDLEIRRLQKRVGKVAERMDAWLLLGRAWVRKARESADPGYYLHGGACAEVVLSRDPDSAPAQNLSALVLLNHHRFAEARDAAEQILQRDSDDLLALGTLSDASLALGRFEDAVAAAQKRNDLKPDLPSYSRASYLRWLQGDIAAAKSIARAALRAGDPRDPEPGAWVTVQAAMIFWHEGDHDGADRGFEEALKRVQDYPAALVGRARVAMARGDHARAAELLERAYERSPRVETAWLLGDAREAAGDAPGAEDAYALVTGRGPQHDDRTLALFHATRNRDIEEAVRLARKEAKTRGDIYTQDTLAWALYRRGLFEEARAASDRAIALGTKDAVLLYHAGAIRIASGRRVEGEKLVREALRLNPHFDRTGAAEAEQLLGREGR
jgi:tetratricopeptide (TPR) repeat protein